MADKPFPWRKLTPAQVALIERLTSQGGSFPYQTLGHAEILALHELRQLKLTDMRVGERSKVEAVLTEEGLSVRDRGFQMERVVVRVTDHQTEFLRFLDDGAPDESGIGCAVRDMPSHMKDVCRRMCLRGWAEAHTAPNGAERVRLTASGHEVLAAINGLKEAVEAAAEARANGRLN